MSILDKLKNNSTIKDSSILGESKYFTSQDQITTNIPMLNVAFSGNLEGGFVPGLTVFAGPSKHFKTNMCLISAKAFLDKYDDGVLLLYDSEFGITPEYLGQFGIDTARVIHSPIEHIEQLKFDIMKQLDAIDRDDHVMIVIDSIGNLASKKELEDALDGKSVADMSRAKALKGLFRMITPYLNTRNLPMFVVNHTYKEIGMFPKDIMSGGTGVYYSANQIFFMGRRQQKTGQEVTGFDFVINVEKSRYVKEKSKIPVSVDWDSGVDRFSGLLDVALAGGFVVKPNNGWYSRMDPATGAIEEKKYREKDTHNDEFWGGLLNSQEFKNFIKESYTIGYKRELELDIQIES